MRTKCPKVPSPPYKRMERKIFFQLYQSLVCSTLDYSSPTYYLAPEFQPSILDPNQNSALRICTGTFQTSSSRSLSFSPLPPSHLHRKPLFLNLQHPRTPFHHYLSNTIYIRIMYKRAYCIPTCVHN